jgi:ubiquinone/menaquinone biosynthesis C-methylase UbiE
MNAPQVDSQHYTFDSYAFEGRFVSYYWQLREVLARNPTSVLEVGVGDGVFGSFVAKNTGVSYESVDIAPDLDPDVVGSVTELPFPSDHADVACAFEVLEHLPFEDFETALGELCRVARRYVVLSLPHFGPMILWSLKLPFLPQLRFAVKLPVPQRHVFNGQHFWEIGKRGYSKARIRTCLEKRGTIVADFIPFNSPYHHFFALALSPDNRALH